MPTPIPGRKPDVPKNFFGPLLDGFDDSEIIDFFRKREYPVEHLYRDTENYITVGAGHMIEDENEAVALPFKYGYDKISRRPATQDEIRRGFSQLPHQDESKKFTSAYFEPKTKGLTPLYLDKSDIDDILKQDIRIKVQDVRRNIRDYDELPIPVRQALLDMQFNMGPKFNEQKWPALYDAIRERDWAKAAYESHRKQVDLDRNNRIRDLFLDGYRRD